MASQAFYTLVAGVGPGTGKIVKNMQASHSSLDLQKTDKCPRTRRRGSIRQGVPGCPVGAQPEQLRVHARRDQGRRGQGHCHQHGCVGPFVAKGRH